MQVGLSQLQCCIKQKEALASFKMTDIFPIIWGDFHFLRPQFLWGFVGVGVILILGLLSTRENARWKKHIAPHLRPFVISKGSRTTKIVLQLIQAIALSCAVLALAGPTWKKVQLPGQILETPMVILLDLSQSMLATDIQPTRLERAKFKISDLLDSKPGARISLVGFAGTAHTIVPLTRDYKIIKNHVETLSPKVMPFRGSDVQKALDMADTLMSVTTAPGTVLIFSDDFDNQDFEVIQNFLEPLKSTTPSRNKIEIMPMNTPSGADVPAYSGGGFLKNDGKPIHSSLNSALLSQIGGLENVTIHQLTLDNSDVELIAKNVSDHLKFTEAPTEKEDEWRDVGLLLAAPSALLILMWFRKGWVVFSLLMMVSLSSCNSSNKVEDFNDLWFTRDYQGQKESKAGHFVEAANLYKDPLRQGVAYFKAGEYDEAIRAFSRDTSAMGAYNLGLAYVQNGDLAAAQLAFGEAIKLDPENETARNNYNKLGHVLEGESEASMADAQEAGAEKGKAKNEQNKSPEDLSGGGQKASKKDMEKERLEETVNTDIRKAKEQDEVPVDFKSGENNNQQKVMMQKLDDDPARFLMKKFEFEAKRKKLKPNPDEKPW